MSWFDGLRERARLLLRRAEVERELEEELAFHLEEEAARVRGAGVSEQAAGRRARIAFGGADRYREEVRDTWTGSVARGIAQDVRHGTRRLRKQPGFTLVVLVTLALGIGANAAMFSLVRAVLIEPLPYGAPDELVVFWNPSRSLADDTWFSERELLEYRAATRSFAALAAYTDGSVNLRDEQEPERVSAGYVTANLFGTLGVGPVRGREFTEADAAPDADPVVMLSHGLWQRRYGGAAGMVGQAIDVNGRARQVIGIMPAGFQLPLDYREERPTEVWLPVQLDASAELPWGDRSYYLIGRLAGGVSAATATADLDRAQERWLAEGLMKPSNAHSARAAVPFEDLLLGSVRPGLLILFAAVAVIFLIACVNVMHLLLARADTRRAEVATQAALGASRWRLTRRLLVETLLLSGGGAVLGVAVSHVALRAALVLVPVNVIRTRDVSLDLSVLAFATLLALVATALAGMAPALELARVDVARTLSSARGERGAMRRRLRGMLVVVETALSLVLVVGGVLLARSFAERSRIELGFDTDDVLTFRVALPAAEYDSDERVTVFFRTLIDRIGELPGVTSAAAVRFLPLTGTIGDWSITIEDRDQLPNDDPNGDWQIVTPGYFETMGIELLAGRYPTAADHADGPLVAVINETMAKKYWPGENAVGRRFHLGNGEQPWIEIVGITRPVRHNAVIEDPRQEMYLVHAQWVRAKNGGSPQYGMTIVARTTGDPLALVPGARAAVRALDPRLPVADVRTLEQVTAHALAQPRFTTTLLLLFAGLALALALIGLYGVIAFIAARRTHEIGLRMALGARPRSVTLLIMSEGVAFAATGIALGIPAAAAAARLLESQLYGVGTLDPGTYIAVPLSFLAVAALASYLPARRAGRVSPLTALRGD